MQEVNINELVDSVKEQVIRWRRYLHQHPELSFHEEKTAQFVYETLETFNNLELSRPTPNSVMARLVGSKPGKVLAIRADMDALPIEEANDIEYKSQNNGVMHACGHDGHTSMLLGAAKILSDFQAELQGEIRFLFQHAEEVSPGGAEDMVQAGVMDGVDMIIGQHLWSSMDTGKVGISYGPTMAAPDTFWITIHGKGGHAAVPQQTIDAIAIGAQVVTNLQHIVSRNTDPLDNLVVSVTQFHGGTTHNVIPGTVEMQGTVRSFDPNLRAEAPKLMERVIRGICDAHGATYTFTYENGYRAVINDEPLTRVIEETVRELYGEEAIDRIRPSMGGEDFSAFQQKAPGSFFFTGSGNVAKGTDFPHHHPNFNIDEDALERGVKVFVSAAFKLLA
ncbi:N-acyl-L-amino acid amidohydrolase [Tumebacillus algifaecis]|uniref:N-acyl-L-amino acid amidohydrolase n=1 Tax=Tumebacillus algifaecis TaxID=1214604 RepID=A0A223CWC7_9BACL|nr:M20 family metallopeptidase [Tumebacillus algifaecis]ASS73600.1 N-acyl-L-amino acid amidohydrolase [Tumebacillus algifaecis]